MFKDDILDYWRAYKYPFILSTLLCGWLIYMASIMGCQLQLDDYTVVYGNCRSIEHFIITSHNLGNINLTISEQFKEYSDNKQLKNFISDGNLLPTGEDNLIIEEETCPQCPEQSICPTTTLKECPVCEVCSVCQECVKCPHYDIQEIQNARPRLDSSAYQQGYFDMKKLCVNSLGGKASKFNEGPGIGETPKLDKNVYVVFTLQGDEFRINKTWNVLDMGKYWLLRPNQTFINQSM